MNNNSPVEIDPKKEFEIILNRFSNIVAEARDLSDNFYSKSKSLIPFELECDQEKCSETPSRDGVINALHDISDSLTFINRRNQEISKHLNNIV